MTSEEHKARRLAKWATRIDIARSAESSVAHLHQADDKPVKFMTDVEHHRRLRRRLEPSAVYHPPVRVGEAASVSQQENIFASDFGLTKHDGIWRPLSGTGEIHGLPASRGRAIATNGVLIAIDVNREAPFIGHVAWWIADDDEDEEVLKDVKPRKTKKQKIMSELIDC